jgi:hypothetical protein
METTKASSEKEFLAGLLANLALEEENAEKIVAHGGIPALLKTFESNSKKTVEASSRAIGRLAQQSENLDDLVRAGAITTLVKTMDANRNDAAVVAAITPTLTKFASTPEKAQRVLLAGGVEAVVATLAAHPEFEQHSADAVAFLENLGTADFDMQRLVSLGVIPAVVKAMKQHPTNADLQLTGSRVLIYLSYSEDTATAIVNAGGMEVCTRNLSFGEKPAVIGPTGAAAASTLTDKEKAANKEVVLTTVYLITSLALVPANKAVLVASGAVDRLLNAVAVHSNEELIRETADELLATVIGEEQV